MPSKNDGHKSPQKHKSDTYINVYFYDFGQWGAWVREPKVGGKRLFIGTHLTERLAARCQDRALLKMEMEPSCSTRETKLNFDFKEDEHLRKTLTTVDFLKYLSGESRREFNKFEPTHCLIKVLAEEETLGNLISEGNLAFCAPKLISKDTHTSKSNKKKRKKKQNCKDNQYSSDEESHLRSDHYPSELEDDHKDKDEGLQLAIDPYANTLDPLMQVATFIPWALKKQRSRRSSICTTLLSNEKEAIEALLILASGLPKKKFQH